MVMRLESVLVENGVCYCAMDAATRLPRILTLVPSSSVSRARMWGNRVVGHVHYALTSCQLNACTCAPVRRT